MADNLDVAPVDESALREDAATAAANRMRRSVDRRGVLGVTEPQAAPPVPGPAPGEDNPYATFLRDGQAPEDDVGLYERARLNAVNSFYRGSLAGASRLALLANLKNTQDEPGLAPGMKKARDEQRGQYDEIVGDLARYDLIKPWGTTLEATAALGGSIGGSLLSPESVAGVGAKGVTWLGRTAMAAAQQAGIMMTVDPIVQGLNIKAGVEQHYDPVRTLMAGGMGAIVGGGLHAGGELIGNWALKRYVARQAKEDPAFRGDISESAPPEAPPVIDITNHVGETTIDVNGQRTTVRNGEVVQPTAEAPRPEPGVPAPIAKEAPPLPYKKIKLNEISSDENQHAYIMDAKGDLYDVSDTTGGHLRAIGDLADQEGVKLSVSAERGEPVLGDGEVYIADYQGQRGLVNITHFKDQLSFNVVEGALTPSQLTALRRMSREIAGPGDNLFFTVEDRKGRELLLSNNIRDLEPYVVKPAAAATVAAEPRAAAAGNELALAARQSGGALPMERQRPQAGIPSQTTTGTAVATVATTPAEDVAVRSLQQQAFDLADAIGFPLRQGRIKNKDALGIFNTGTGVVRVREVPDFEVVAHEAGHAIEEKAGTDLTNLTNQFGGELTPLVTNPTAYDPSQHVKEGFAEYVRRFLGNPAHAQQVAPGFDTAFRNFMEASHPDMMAALDNASKAYRAYLDAPSVDAIASTIRSMDENPTGWRGALKYVKDNGFAASIKAVMQNFYTAGLDQYAPVARAVREVANAIREREGTALVDLKMADNPEVLLRMVGRSQQAAVLDVMDGVRPHRGTTPEGPSLSAAMAKALDDQSHWGKWDPDKKQAFSTYLVARRAVNEWDRFNAGDLSHPPVAFSRGDAVAALAEMERMHPNFREGSDMVHNWTRQLLRKQYEGGLIERDLYDKLLQRDFYVPFMRDLSDKPVAGGTGASPEGPGMTETVKRFKGSARDILDPIESLITQAFLVNRTLRHNDVIQSFVKYFGRAGTEGGRYVEPLSAREAKKYTFDLGDAVRRKAQERGVDPVDTEVMVSGLTDVFGEDPIVGSFFHMEPAGKRGEPIVFYKEGGQLRAARFMSKEEGHDLYGLITAMPAGLTDTTLEMLAKASTVLRVGVTTNPVFAVTNYIRDQLAASILRSDYIPFISGIKGIVAEAKQSESAALYGYAGGVSAGAKIAPLEQASNLPVDALRRTTYLSTRLNSLHGLMEFASITEAGTRNSIFDTVYKAKRAQGLSENEAMIEAAYNATDIMDFGRHGSKTEAVVKLTPFLNAHMQGLDKARRTLFDPLIDRIQEAAKTRGYDVGGGFQFEADREAWQNAKLSWFKLAGVFGVLGAAWAAIHQDDPIYNDAPTEVKSTHFVTSIGGKMVVIPKPFELSIGFTTGEYAFRRWIKDDPRAAGQWADSVWDVIKPPAPLMDNPFIKTTYELAMGKTSFPSFWSPREMVSDSLKRLDAGQQYTDRSSSLAKTLGKTIGVSPIKVDHAIGGYFGLWGRDVMALSSAIDKDSPTANWADTVFARRFIKDPTRNSDVTSKFWGFMAQSTGKFNQAVATYQSFIDRRSPEGDADASTFLSKLPNAERAYVTLQRGADEDGKPAFGAEQKRLHPLARAYDANQVLIGIRKEMDRNSFATLESGERQPLDDKQRGGIRDAVRELGQMEQHNALVITKEPGYAGRAMLDTNLPMAKIRAISPAVADDIVTRYATAKIYTTKALAGFYDQMQGALLRDGSQADLSDFAGDAGAGGYEFGGERVKKPQKRRIQIQGQPAAAQ